MKTGLIGCGNMGGGMARRLLSKGTPALCYDPNDSIMQALKKRGCPVAQSANEVASKVDILFLSLPTAEIVESVMTTIDNSIQLGCIVVDTSTSKPETSQKLSAIATNNGYYFLDAPVSGGPVAANAGSMTMLIGGDLAAFETAKPILEIITARIVKVGASGAGHAAKIANNMLCAANLILVGEAIKLAEAAGVSAAGLLEGINAGSGRSAVSEINYPRWILNDSFDSGFTMGLMRKDVRLALELADGNGIKLPGFSKIAAMWGDSASTLPDSDDFNRIYEFEGGSNE
ncbi:MAG: 3-hydroxyisobutyrate dehydrogenase [Granulosicoccus sp.]